MKNQEHPADFGILVLNLQTVIALGELCSQQKEQGSRYLTVADLFQGKATVVKLPAQTKRKAADVLEKAFGKQTGVRSYIGGGALSSRELTEQDVIDETVNFLAYGEAPDYEKASSCKGCGGCTKNCPMGIEVYKIVRQIEKGNKTVNSESLKEFQPENCIGCSACTYGCPAGKNLQGMMANINGKA